MAFDLDSASKTAGLLISNGVDGNLNIIRLALESARGKTDRDLTKIIGVIEQIFEFFGELSLAKDGNYSFTRMLDGNGLHNIASLYEAAAECKPILSSLKATPDANIKQVVENTLPDLRGILNADTLRRLKSEAETKARQF